MTNQRDGRRKNEGTGAGSRSHRDRTDLESQTAYVLKEQCDCEQRRARGVSGGGEAVFPGIAAQWSWQRRYVVYGSGTGNRTPI